MAICFGILTKLNMKDLRKLQMRQLHKKKKSMIHNSTWQKKCVKVILKANFQTFALCFQYGTLGVLLPSKCRLTYPQLFYQQTSPKTPFFEGHGAQN
uniref:Uncharacterized protein n=1 Tax=Acrobeloides nanus TaxID=290746 RepID=A0A914DK52_9BILA